VVREWGGGGGGGERVQGGGGGGGRGGIESTGDNMESREVKKLKGRGMGRSGLARKR